MIPEKIIVTERVVFSRKSPMVVNEYDSSAYFQDRVVISWDTTIMDGENVRIIFATKGGYEDLALRAINNGTYVFNVDYYNACKTYTDDGVYYGCSGIIMIFPEWTTNDSIDEFLSQSSILFETEGAEIIAGKFLSTKFYPFSFLYPTTTTTTTTDELSSSESIESLSSEEFSSSLSSTLSLSSESSLDDPFTQQDYIEIATAINSRISVLGNNKKTSLNPFALISNPPPVNILWSHVNELQMALKALCSEDYINPFHNPITDFLDDAVALPDAYSEICALCTYGGFRRISPTGVVLIGIIQDGDIVAKYLKQDMIEFLTFMKWNRVKENSTVTYNAKQVRAYWSPLRSSVYEVDDLRLAWDAIPWADANSTELLYNGAFGYVVFHKSGSNYYVNQMRLKVKMEATIPVQIVTEPVTPIIPCSVSFFLTGVRISNPGLGGTLNGHQCDFDNLGVVYAKLSEVATTEESSGATKRIADWIGDVDEMPMENAGVTYNGDIPTSSVCEDWDYAVEHPADDVDLYWCLYTDTGESIHKWEFTDTYT